MSNRTIRNMVLAALFLALGFVLPFLTGQIPQIGSMLLPMHIPVLLCGFVCGPFWGLAVGAICPILRSLVFSMPSMYPSAVAMAFELAVYGFASGLLYKLLPRNKINVYVSLLGAMIAGRVVWGVVRLIMTVGSESTFPMSAFIAGAVTTAIPGIILQIVVIPVLVIILEKHGFTEEQYAAAAK
ncbi:MAG: ECF transporter S component [Oscillospiraceae bacterium]